jgi:nucleotide-binding universal stress UspA family protein
MKRFKNILFFADGAAVSSSALQRAVALARANDARLTLVDVVDPVSTPAEITARFALDLNDLLKQRRREQLESLTATLGPPAVRLDIRVLSGVGFIEVIRAVQRDGFDLVIKQAQGPAGFADRLFGGTDMHLLRKCPCPVWIDRASDRARYERILAAVDPSSGGSDAVSRLVMDLATSLAQRESASCAVLHAWQMEGEALLRDGRVQLPGLEMRHLLDGTERRHRDALAGLLAHYDIAVDSSSVHLVKGQAAPAIRDTAAAIGADLIVMGTVGRTGLPGFFIGNTAEEVLLGATASVLAVKPDGFVSPVA